MVLIEEVEDDDVAMTQQPETDKRESAGSVAEDTGPFAAPASASAPVIKKGFLNDESKAPLYPPEGSPEGEVAPETHKAHMEHNLSNKLNANINPMEAAHGDLPKPDWYTPEWPKGCQYNSPGCVLALMETSEHQTQLHREMVTKHQRWQQALKGGEKTIRLSFLQLKDEDVKDLFASLKGNDVVEEMDLSHNEIMDVGIQTLVGALANGAAPNLKELRLYENKWGELGRTMLEGGLKVLRKKLVVHLEAPSLKMFKEEPTKGAYEPNERPGL